MLVSVFRLNVMRTWCVYSWNTICGHNEGGTDGG